MSEAMEGRLARIESHVEHIDAVTTDLRVELRRTNDKMDGNYKELNKKIDEGLQATNKKIDDNYKESGNTFKEMNKKIDDVKDKLHSMTIWALLLYVTLAGGLLTIIGRAFKWI